MSQIIQLMEYSEFGIYSRNIITFDAILPIEGVIIVKEGLIDSVIPHRGQNFDTWESNGIPILDHRDDYISPGIVDMNVTFNGKWESYESGTKAAIAGGVTLIVEHETPVNPDVTPDYEKSYCDVGVAKLITD